MPGSKCRMFIILFKLYRVDAIITTTTITTYQVRKPGHWGLRNVTIMAIC